MPVVSVAVALAVLAAEPPALPLKKMRLYETGVAYFERSGRLDARGAFLPVATGHLDDVLKTLVVLSTDGSRVQGVEFNSSVSKGMARTLAGLPAEANAPIHYEDLLGSLKGAPVRLTTTSGEVFGARIVDVQEEEVVERVAAEKGATPGKEAPPAVAAVKELVLLLVTDRAEVRRVRARDVVSVKPTEAGFAGRLGAALDSLSAHGARAERALRVEGSAGSITVGYIGEAPLWRTTYRLVLGEKGKNALQGWALVHNDTDEDWDSVRLELVNGRPDSFLFPLAAPRYSSRELVTPDSELSTVPQLLDSTVDQIWGDHLPAGAGEIGASLSGSASGGGGYGMGMGSLGGGHGAVSMHVGSGSSTSSDLLEVGHLAEVPDAEGTEAGVLFTYRLAQPIHLRARASVLVPFLRKAVDAEPVTWFATASDAARCAVRFTNSSEQTLPSGPISVFSEGGFSGEATLDRLKPGERRFLQFGADLDVELSAVQSEQTEQVKRLALRRDQLEEHYLRKVNADYQLENRSGLARTVYVGLDVNSNAKVQGADRVEFEPSSSRPVAIFQLKPKSKRASNVEVVEGLVRRTPVASLTAARLLALAKLPDLPDADRRAAHEAGDKQGALERTVAGAGQARVAIAEAEKDVDRLREHLRAAGGAVRDNPFVQRLVAAEDHLTALRQQLAALEAERVNRADAVRTALAALAKVGPADAVSHR